MGIWPSKSETKVLPHNNEKNLNSPCPPGALSSQGRGMSVSRLALNMDPSSESDDESIGEKIMKQNSSGGLIRNNSNNLQASSNPPSPVPPEPKNKQMETAELKGKEMGYWYFDIGASFKNKSWKVMEINAAGRQLSGGMHTVHSKKKKQ